MNRLKEMLPKVIAPNQCSFVPERQISNNMVIIQEIVHSMRIHRGGKRKKLLKLDLEKKYDRINWDFILDTLRELGLPNTLVYLIIKCVTGSSMKVFWNKKVTNGFNPSIGIR